MKGAVNSTDILSSWKEIASHLSRSVRTAQRWEAELGLPVLRPRKKNRSAVMAMRSEVDEWMRRVSVVPTPHETNPLPDPRFDAGGWRFLMTEIGCGFTFVSLAQSARPDEREKYKRNVRNARKAYDTVIKFWRRIQMNDQELTQLSAGLSRLENALQDLGGLPRAILQLPAAHSSQAGR